jgi:hypothetical protein
METMVRKKSSVQTIRLAYLVNKKSTIRSLSWIVLAKRQETRQSRIDKVVESVGQNLKPKHLQYLTDQNELLSPFVLVII